MRGLADHLSIGERIAFYRKRRGYTQEVLAGLVGRSTDWLAKIETGRRKPPRIDMLVVAPASANMVAKLATGVMDNQALTQVGEAIDIIGLPVVVFPRVNAAHARHPAWQHHIDTLRAGGRVPGVRTGRLAALQASRSASRA